MIPTLLASLPDGPGPVYRDPRAKAQTKAPYCFNVVRRTTAAVEVTVHRYRTEDDAMAARQEWTT